MTRKSVKSSCLQTVGVARSMMKISRGVSVGVGVVVVLTLMLVDVTGAPVDNISKDDATNDQAEAEKQKDAPRESEEEKRCSEMIGRFWKQRDGSDPKWEGLEVLYDLKEVLEKHGGPPGKVNATWTEKSGAPVAENATDDRPLPIADEQYWLYSYVDSAVDVWARGEHAVRRFTGTPKEFLEIRGVVIWQPADFCGRRRKAFYVVDDRGFTFHVTREYCWVGEDRYSCAWPAVCEKFDDGSQVCIAAPQIGLLASLVGGG